MNDWMYRRFARVLIEAALQLQRGDVLVIQASPRDYLLVREITALAYKHGAKYVKTEYEDDFSDAARCLYADEAYLPYYPPWLSDYHAAYARENICWLILLSPDPVANNALEERRLIAVENGNRQGRRAFEAARAGGHVSRVVTAVPTAPWARLVYPELGEDAALQALWDDFLKIVRLDEDDPVAAWRAHQKELLQKKMWLDSLQIKALHFVAPGTDLYVELADNAAWIGGYDINTATGVRYIPNIPTEELFTAPHKYKVEGVVRSTMPLSHNGVVVDDICLRLEKGKVVSFSASRGEKTLQNILEADENAARLGEVALVPVTSPIYKTGRVFLNTLFDENAVCHLALGRALPGAANAQALCAAARDAAGVNESAVHVDFMIGSPEMDVYAIDGAGVRTALMEKGLWAVLS